MQFLCDSTRILISYMLSDARFDWLIGVTMHFSEIITFVFLNTEHLET